MYFKTVFTTTEHKIKQQLVQYSVNGLAASMQKFSATSMGKKNYHLQNQTWVILRKNIKTLLSCKIHTAAI